MKNNIKISSINDITLLITLLKSPINTHSRSVIVQLQCVLHQSSHIDMNHKIECIQTLINLINISPPDDLKSEAIRALKNFASYTDYQSIICDNNGIQSVISLLQSSSEATKEQAAGVLCNLAIDHKNHPKIIAFKGIPNLISLLTSDSFAVIHEALKALKNLARKPDLQETIRQAGILPHLLNLLDDSNEIIKQKVIAILCAIVNQDLLSFNSKPTDGLTKLALIVNTLDARSTGHLFIRLIENNKLAILELICLCSKTSTLTKFRDWLGCDLLSYIELNVPTSLPRNHLISELSNKFPDEKKAVSRYLPEKLKINLDHQALLTQQLCCHFLKISPDDFWRLCIDFPAQINNDSLVFDEEEPGYLAGLTNGWQKLQQTFEHPLSPEMIIGLHDAAIIYLSTDDKYGRVFNEKNQPLKLGLAMMEYGWHYTNNLLKNCNEKAHRENETLTTWLCEIFEDNKVRGQFHSYQEATQKAQRIINEYHKKLQKPSVTDREKLGAIAWLCKQLEMLHMLPDGNQRTISFLILNRELLRCGFGLCILPDPLCFDGHLDVDTLAAHIQAGQELAKIYLYKTSSIAQLVESISLSPINTTSLAIMLPVINIMMANPESKQQLISNGITKIILFLLTTVQDEELIEYLIEALTTLADKVNSVSERVILKLTSLLRSPNPIIQKQVALIFCHIAGGQDNQRFIREANAIFELITLLQSPSDSVKCLAITALWKATFENPANVIAFNKANGIAAMSKLLQSASRAVISQTLGILFDLANNPGCPQLIIKADLIKPCISLLNSSSEVIQKRAIGVLYNLTDDDDGQLSIIKAGGIKALILSLKESSDAPNKFAYSALYNLIQNRAAGVLSFLALLQSPDDFIQPKVIDMLANAMLEPPVKKLLLEERGLSILIKMLKSSEDNIQIKICQLLEKIALNCAASLLEIYRINGIATLLATLECSSDEVRFNVLLVLSSLTSHPIIQTAIRKEDGVNILIAMLNSPCVNIQTKTLELLSSLSAHNAKNRTAIVENKGIPKLMNILASSETAPQENALKTLINCTMFKQKPSASTMFFYPKDTKQDIEKINHATTGL